MKKFLSLFLATLMLCTSMAAAVDVSDSISSDPPYAVKTNELAVYLEECNASASDENLISAVNQYCTAYKNLGVFSDDELTAMGYSDETVALVSELRANPDYQLTLSELNDASATMTFYPKTFVASTANNTTDVTFNWTFRWDSRPTVCRTDAIYAAWSLDESVVRGLDYTVTYSDGVTRTYSDGIYGMKVTQKDEQSMYMTFRMGRDDSANAWCKSGSGTFTIHADTRYTFVQAKWGYGHQNNDVDDVEINVTWGSAGLKFDTEDNYATMFSNIQTFYVN